MKRMVLGVSLFFGGVILISAAIIGNAGGTVSGCGMLVSLFGFIIMVYEAYFPKSALSNWLRGAFHSDKEFEDDFSSEAESPNRETHE